MPTHTVDEPPGLQANCEAGAGSSRSNRASEAVERLAFSKRLVNEVFKNTWTFTGGIAAPGAVGMPPTQFKTKSPTNSVMPSDRAGVDTPPLAKHWNGVVGCALAVTDKPSRR